MPASHHFYNHVFAELGKLKASKSAGPNQITPGIIKEFAYEFLIPFTNILNCSFSEGIVPEQWKKAIVVPVPKKQPPSIDKLRPVSLTSRDHFKTQPAVGRRRPPVPVGCYCSEQ